MSDNDESIFGRSNTGHHNDTNRDWFTKHGGGRVGRTGKRVCRTGDRIARRLQDMGISARAIDLADELATLRELETLGRSPKGLSQVVNMTIDGLEAEQIDQPFLAPPPHAGLDSGEVHLFNTDEREIRFSILPGAANPFIHAVIAGKTKSGKSYLLAQLASQMAARDSATLVIDQTQTMRQLPIVRDTHDFISGQDLRIGLWDGIQGAEVYETDLAVNEVIAHTFGLQFSEFFLAKVIDDIRPAAPSAPHVKARLESMKLPGFSSEARYRSSLIQVLDQISRFPVFQCSRGMSLEDLVQRNLVLEVTWPPPITALVLRWIFRMLTIRARTQGAFHRPLVLVFDESQSVFAGRVGDDFATAFVQLRHANIHAVTAWQNINNAAPEVLGNADLVVGFQLTDAKDRQRFAQCTGLNREQERNLSTLETGQCVVYTPRTAWPYPFMARVPHLISAEASHDEMRAESKRVVQSLPWQACASHDSQTTTDMSSTGPSVRVSSALEEDVERQRLELDIVTPAFRFDPLTKRGRRIGMKSTSKLAALARNFESSGLVKSWKLPNPKGRGAPWQLLQPLKPLLDKHNVSWERGRGSVPTQAATYFIRKRVLECDSEVSVIPEGSVNGHQTDLVLVSRTGKRYAVEIAGATALHEPANAQQVLTDDAIERFFVIGLTKSVAADVQRLLREVPVLSGNPRITVRSFSEAMKHDWTLE